MPLKKEHWHDIRTLYLPSVGAGGHDPANIEQRPEESSPVNYPIRNNALRLHPQFRVSWVSPAAENWCLPGFEDYPARLEDKTWMIGVMGWLRCCRQA